MYLAINLYIYTCISPSHIQKSQWYLKVVTPGVKAMSPMEGEGPGRVPREGDKVQLGQLVGGWTNPSEKYVCQIGNLP